MQREKAEVVRRGGLKLVPGFAGSMWSSRPLTGSLLIALGDMMPTVCGFLWEEWTRESDRDRRMAPTTRRVWIYVVGVGNEGIKRPKTDQAVAVPKDAVRLQPAWKAQEQERARRKGVKEKCRRRRDRSRQAGRAHSRCCQEQRKSKIRCSEVQSVFIHKRDGGFVVWASAPSLGDRQTVG